MRKKFMGILVIIIIIGNSGMNVYAADVYIPDPNFKAFLVTNYDTSGDGEIQEVEAQAVTGTMETPGNQTQPGNIADLTGIGAFTYLTGLICYYEQLTSLDVSANHNLTYLECYSNQMTNLDVGVNLNLANLYCDSNQLTNLDVSSNPNLTYLECYSNKLTSLDVSANLNLIHLDCYSNQLTNLDVSANLNLAILYCDYNRLTSLDVTNNPSLISLWCDFNQLTNLDVSANPNLSTLFCGSNQLSDIPDVTSCSSMEYYDCAYNYFGSDDCPTIAAINNMGLSTFIYNPQDDGNPLDCGSVAATIDFNGNGNHDIALFSPANHKWYIKDQSTPTYGTTDCLPVPGDYDGDGVTDLAVVDLTRPDGMAKWYLNGIGVFIYGLQEWIPVPGDYDGDGITDAALFNPDTGKWYVRNQFVTTYGAGGIPIPGDYDGDGITDIAVFNPANNKWYIKDIGIFTYGMADCIPVPGDYDGDGITDLAVIDTSRPDGMAKWYIRDQAVFIYGAVVDTIPVPGDYDGDGAADPCLFYQNTGKWYCRDIGVCTYGNGDMIPLAGNLATRYAMSILDGGNIAW